MSEHTFGPAPRDFTGQPINGDGRWVCIYCGQRITPYWPMCPGQKTPPQQPTFPANGGPK